MEYSDYSYSAITQASFFKAEAALLKLDNRLTNSPFAQYVKETMLAIDAIFSIRMSHDVTLPVVPLITAYSLTDWKYHGDTEQSVQARCPYFKFPEDAKSAAKQALHYMQAINWISSNVSSNSVVTIDTVLFLHEVLLDGLNDDNRYHGFRRTPLPHKKGFEPSMIASAVNDLCSFINTDSFSPLGQASTIHHAFERIVPFDSLTDRTGLVLAFLPMFKRGLFSSGYVAPICWGASIDRDRRKQLKDSSRSGSRSATYESHREYWAVHNAQNTYYAALITNSFFDAAELLRAKWRSQGLQIQANSALDKLLDLFLAVPGLSTGRASAAIKKSYGATNEAMCQLVQAGIIREVAVDGRERVFICDQSAAMIVDFVDRLMKISSDATISSLERGKLSWETEARSFIAYSRQRIALAL